MSDDTGSMEDGMRRSVRVLGIATTLGLAIGAGLAGAQARTSAPAPSAGSGKPQDQKVLPPEARHWMGATTGAGMLAMGGMANGGKPSMADLMRMASGGVPTDSRSVLLKLGSSLATEKGEPEAFHTMPPGAQVSKPIYLETPQAGGRPGTSVDGYRQPKGQISFYWGCAEKAGPGQPVVLTFEKLMRGEDDQAVAALDGSVSAREVRKPSVNNAKTYGDWPHADRKNRNKGLEAAFPAGSTIAGQHVIVSNYGPKVDFTLPAGKSFMDAVRYTATAVQPSGAIVLTWRAPPRATGYSVGVMAPETTNDDSANFVMWSSADRPATFIQMEDLTPAEVNRLIGLKAVLPAATTTCAVPAEVVKATKDGSMLMFTAFGDEATFIDPPRPADPRVTCDQEWFSRVSFKSVRMDMISPKGVQDPTAMSGDAAPKTTTTTPQQPMTDEEYCKSLAERSDRPSVADAVPGGRFLRRALGKKKEEPPADPRCVPKE